MSLLIKIVLIVASLYVLALIGAHFLQRRLTYYPDIERVPPAVVGLTHVEERIIPTPDGERIVAWWGHARPGMPTLLYFHGNAGSLATRADRIARFLDRGAGVFMMTYRGFGGSSGTPSERNNVADAKLAYEALVAAGVAPSEIVLYGESLGTGVAMQVAVARPAAGIILDAPYTSLLDVAELHYPHLPSRYFMTDRYDTMKFLPGLKMPLLIVHGTEDRVVPAAMGLAIHQRAPGTKEIALIPGAGHSDHAQFGSTDIIFGWIDRLRSGELGRVAPRAAE